MIPGPWDGSRGWHLVRSEPATALIRPASAQRRGATPPLEQALAAGSSSRAGSEPSHPRQASPRWQTRAPRRPTPVSRRSARSAQVDMVKKKEHRHARGPVQIKNPPRHAQTRRRQIQPPSPSPPPTQSRRSPPRAGVRTQPNPRFGILVSALAARPAAFPPPLRPAPGAALASETAPRAPGGVVPGALHNAINASTHQGSSRHLSLFSLTLRPRLGAVTVSLARASALSRCTRRWRP